MRNQMKCLKSRTLLQKGLVIAIIMGMFPPLAVPRTSAGQEKRAERAAVSSPVAEDLRTSIENIAGRLPLRFEANQGQSEGPAKFLSHGSNYTLFLAPTETVMTLGPSGATASPEDTARRRTTLRMRWIGMNPQTQLVGREVLPARSHYFIGNDPKNWSRNIPSFAKVEYRDLYPGISLVYYGNQRQLEYDFVLSPGADPRTIRLAFEGAEKIGVDPAGDLVLQTAAGEVRQRKPVIYQETNGARKVVEGRYVMEGKRRVGFRVASYDKTKPLVIDPVLGFATYLGGSDGDEANGVAIDAAGNIYVTGITQSANFPVTGNAVQRVRRGARSVFVTKLGDSGRTLIYSTYIGGNGNDRGQAIAVDAAGNAYVTGVTDSTNFPTVNPMQPINQGGADAFIFKLAAAGNALVYSTYLGGYGNDRANSIAVDAAGAAYVTGISESTNFPTANPLQGSNRGTANVFVTKLNPAGSGLVYSTYLGGSDSDIGNGIAVDDFGAAYITGSTSSVDFPTVNPIQSANAGDRDAFVIKLNPTGNRLVYSTYLGGMDTDGGNAIAVDSEKNAYVTGFTASADFPLANPIQATFGGGDHDVFVAKISNTGDSLTYATYLGGNGSDVARGIAVNDTGHAYITGFTTSTTFPTVNAIQAQNQGRTDAFLTKVTPDGIGWAYSTYLGGSDDDGGAGLAIEPSGTAYVVGYTASTNFPMVGPIQSTMAGGGDAFVLKIPVVERFFPQFANGPFGQGTFISTLILTNPSQSTIARGEVTLFDDEGGPMAIGFRELSGEPKSRFRFVIPPLGTAHFTSDGRGKPIAGSARVRTDETISGVVLFSSTDNGASGVGESLPLSGFLIPVSRKAAIGLNTGLALVNPSARHVSVDIKLRTLNGQSLPAGVATLHLPPHGHLAKFIGGGPDAFFPNINTDDFQGTLEAVATTPGGRIAAAALQLAPGRLITLPVTPLN